MLFLYFLNIYINVFCIAFIGLMCINYKLSFIYYLIIIILIIDLIISLVLFMRR